MAAAAAAVKVFVNSVDSFTSGQIGEYLANAAIGSTQADDEEDEDDPTAPPKPTYEVIGTLSRPNAPRPKWASRLIPADDRDSLKEAILDCKYVVVDIGSDRGQLDLCRWAVDTMRAEMMEFPRGGKSFVCLSSGMTWGKTRPADPEGDPTAPILEDEYKRRRAHDKFRAEIELEKHVVQQGRDAKGRFRTMVVCAGLQYGAGEDWLHSLFRSAWHLDPPALAVPGSGEQVVPMIHVKDLAAVVHNCLEAPPDNRYILALDDASAGTTLGEVAAAIAEKVGTGKTAPTPLPDVKLDVTVPATVEERLSIDVRLEAAVVKEMNVPWKAQGGLVEAIDAVVEEYRTVRNLKPLRVFVHGPPMCGKAVLAEALAKEYKLNLLTRDSVIATAVAELETAAAKLDESPEAGGDDAPELPDDVLELAKEAREKLTELQAMRDENGGKYEEAQVIEWVKARVLSMGCQNQGYVLCGYPETDDQAREVFAPADDAEDPDAPNPLTVPEFIFALDAPDAVLMERAMALPPAAADSPFSEEGMKAGLPAFRKLNDEETEREEGALAVLDFFDFKEIHPTYLDVSEMTETDVLKAARVVLPAPRNYGPTPAEKAELDRAAAEAKAAADAAAATTKAENDAREFAIHEANMEAWIAKADEIKRQEAEALEASSIPLRTYLMKHVMPTLTQGLAEVCRGRPDDPVDSLAEYLFKNNPRID